MKTSASKTSLGLADIASTASLLKASLYKFVKAAWRIVVRNHTLVNSWHVRAICEHLQAVTEGHIQNLLINIPPRHTKSLIVSVFWPAWVWARNPAFQWLFCSRTQTVSLRDNRKARLLIESPWYQKFFPLELAGDQNVKSYYATSEGGHRQATSAGSQATGLDADAMVIDDLHGINDTEDQITKDVAWVEDTFWSRGNTTTAPKVVIGQRVRANDISGYILAGRASGDWVALVLPMEFEPARKCRTSVCYVDKENGQDHSKGFSDPRTLPGEVLCPNRFPPEWVEEFREKRPGSHARLNQQNPTPSEGGIIKKAWLGARFHALDLADVDGWGTSCDTPFKKGKSTDYYVQQLLAKVGTKFHVVAQIRRRMSFAEMEPAYEGFVKRWSNTLGLTIVNNVLEVKASGDAIKSKLEQSVNIVAYNPGRDSKEQRFEAVSPVFKAGNVLLPAPGAVLTKAGSVIAHLDDSFVEEYVEEVGTVPFADHDDQADATTQYILNELSTPVTPDPAGDWGEPEVDVFTVKRKSVFG